MSDNIVKKAEELKHKYDKLHEQWLEAKEKAITSDEYQETKPLFDEGTKAHKEWRDYSFKHGHKIYAKAKNLEK